MSQTERVLFDFEGQVNIADIEARDVTIALVRDDKGQGLRLQFGHSTDWPGITLAAPEGSWDLSMFQHLSVRATNVGPASGQLMVRVDNPGADGRQHCVQGGVQIEPGATRTLQVALSPTPWRLSKPLELIGMRGAPGNGPLDPSNVIGLIVFVPKPREDHQFIIDDIRVGGRLKTIDADTFLPFIDTFGQFMHDDWPGKVHSLDELRSRVALETKDLEAHPGPPDRDKYGGWTAGPQLEATGFFRVEKHEGKWWLVDPEGRLFWSHGVDCVNPYNSTPLSDREAYFADLPGDDHPLAQFLGQGNWAPHGYYRDHSPYRHYDFLRANLYRKYGEDWLNKYAARCHQRLRSWGMNTIANWSDGRISSMGRTPYVGTIHYGGPRLEGSEGYWGKFYDVFDPDFKGALHKRLAQEVGKTAGDPWCLGYFVDNELGWGSDTSLATAALASPAEQAAKKAFLDDLRAEYKDIAALNEAWGTEHASWEALRQSRTPPDETKAGNDLRAFYRRTAETYFRTILEALREVAPNQLYLGCRFAWVNDIAAEAAAKYCDVVSYNRYTTSVAKLHLPHNLDRPLIIGEFHFGALDRGMFHTGLVPTRDQNHRAEAYESYVRGALRNPFLVGTHWFQFHSQCTTGRGDGENYQIGLLDLCDTPYAETIAAVRRVGEELYEYRLKASSNGQVEN